MYSMCMQCCHHAVLMTFFVLSLGRINYFFCGTHSHRYDWQRNGDCGFGAQSADAHAAQSLHRQLSRIGSDDVLADAAAKSASNVHVSPVESGRVHVSRVTHAACHQRFRFNHEHHCHCSRPTSGKRLVWLSG